MPNITRLATLFSKAVGALLAVAAGTTKSIKFSLILRKLRFLTNPIIPCYYPYAGFFVGKEGPMIHSGAIIGAGIPQFRSIVVKFINFPYPYFRSDRFVATARRLCMHINNSLKKCI